MLIYFFSFIYAKSAKKVLLKKNIKNPIISDLFVITEKKYFYNVIILISKK